MLLFQTVAFKIHDHERNNEPVIDRLFLLNDFCCSLVLLYCCCFAALLCYLHFSAKINQRIASLFVVDDIFRNKFKFICKTVMKLNIVPRISELPLPIESFPQKITMKL